MRKFLSLVLFALSANVMAIEPNHISCKNEDFSISFTTTQSQEKFSINNGIKDFVGEDQEIIKTISPLGVLLSLKIYDSPAQITSFYSVVFPRINLISADKEVKFRTAILSHVQRSSDMGISSVDGLVDQVLAVGYLDCTAGVF